MPRLPDDQILCSDEFVAWYRSLREPQQEDVTKCIEKLETEGIDLGAPHSSAVRDYRGGIRELRCNIEGYALRIFYAFDAQRRAYLIHGGIKTNDRFYDLERSKVLKIWDNYLKER
jgi:hypothetical protein